MTERLPHHELQLLLGAYVLGGLDSADRRRLEEHLPGCPACTAELSRFAAVPALLPLVSLPADAEPLSAPDESLPRLIATVRRRRAARLRRRLMLAVAAVVLVLAGAIGSVVVAGRDTGPPPTTVVSTFNDRTVGQAVLAPKAWGTEVRLNLNYPPYGRQPYTAWAVARDGHEEQAATWTTPPGGRCSVTGATSIRRDQLDRIEVRNADGRTLLRTR